jgi:hypothetical protein
MSLAITPCSAILELTLIAIRTDHLILTRDELGRAVDEVLFDHFPYLGRAACRTLALHRLPREDHTILPVHPEYLAYAAPQGRSEGRHAGMVTSLDAVRLPAMPAAEADTVITPPGRTGRRLLVRTALDVCPSPADLTRVRLGTGHQWPGVVPATEFAGAHFVPPAAVLASLQTSDQALSVGVREETYEDFLEASRR